MCACVVGEGRKCLCTCGQGEGQVVSRGPSSSVTPGLARPREDTRGHGPEPVPDCVLSLGAASGAGNVLGGRRKGTLETQEHSQGNAYKLAWRGGQHAEKCPYNPTPRQQGARNQTSSWGGSLRCRRPQPEWR